MNPLVADMLDIVAGQDTELVFLEGLLDNSTDLKRLSPEPCGSGVCRLDWTHQQRRDRP